MANVFMLFLFESILDAYKYASIKTNEFLQKRRNETFNKFHDESIKLNRLIEELNQLRNQGVNNLFYQQKLQEKYLTEIVFALLNSNDS